MPACESNRLCGNCSLAAWSVMRSGGEFAPVVVLGVRKEPVGRLRMPRTTTPSASTGPISVTDRSGES